MFRATARLLQVTKRTTGIVGLAVHPDPLPVLKQTYNSTLAELKNLPATSSYRQAAEAITLSRLNIVESAQGDIRKVEQTIGGGQIEEILDAAQDELKLVEKQKELKSWEPLAEKPLPGQWKYFGEESTS
ncbi:SubName: Full=Probable NADH-ubiquinone oxidoreductase {ECO:0000313/EMBL:CCA69565.1} [Serendipita indica DSM 11827]|uniref:Probable NADH-ubiquinone oxidoreductase n=1 Tax=Serendipita indica (strain DSM 11827) TaxID=1109443 RepID=G4TE44_SERID|nr:SubName: Full=Probable NADH-ubiquinone oxidoreductase {ECO:0000313/EMBL:CCA69565.1} [Serendipita indica DSM 11827]CCA69565.1 probable NADH-ubiquinone oxidoreductase [Serendipita indica DSM 11827]